MVDKEDIELRTITVEIVIPVQTTVGDFIATRGALMDAASIYVDWEALNNRQGAPISAPGIILMDIARALQEAEKT
jgi:hypothetical protein